MQAIYKLRKYNKIIIYPADMDNFILILNRTERMEKNEEGRQKKVVMGYHPNNDEYKRL